MDVLPLYYEINGQCVYGSKWKYVCKKADSCSGASETFSLCRTDNGTLKATVKVTLTAVCLFYMRILNIIKSSEKDIRYKISFQDNFK